MNKKGELTTTQIIMIIVLIVSFIVILYFILRLNLGSTSASEVCHNSIVISSKGSGIFGGINCATGYVCISSGGTCNLNPTTTISVNSNDKNAIMKAIADQMVNCWWMMGEGQESFSSPGSNACAICSIIGFDSNLQKQYPNGISYKDLFDYLSTNNTDQDGINQTYLTYIYGISDLQSLLSGDSLTNSLYNSVTIPFSSQYSVIVGQGRPLIRIFSNGNYLHPVFLPNNQISTYLDSQTFTCGKFITQS